MYCVYLIDGESPCGDHASKYANFYLCDEHIESMRSLMASRGRTAALQAAKQHELSAFPGICYIVLLPDGAVKIGYSNTDELLKKRITTLSREYKAPVVTLAKVPGGFVAEAVLHDKFQEYRLPGKGERFTYSPEIAKYIASVR